MSGAVALRAAHFLGNFGCSPFPLPGLVRGERWVRACGFPRGRSTGQVFIRDTQHRQLGHLAVPATEWRAFLHAVQHSELD